VSRQIERPETRRREKKERGEKRSGGELKGKKGSLRKVNSSDFRPKRFSPGLKRGPVKS